MPLGNGVKLTWLGHATFLLETPGGKRALIDPWITGNPKCPESLQDPGHLDLILVSHGHSDHTADVVRLAKEKGAAVLAMVELAGWFGSQGVEKAVGFNKGGTYQAEGITVTLTDAHHSSSVEGPGGSIVYTGEPAGMIITVENGYKIYFAGDTCVFGDMALIGELYQPDLAMLPIGDFFTMGPLEAAKAVELLGVQARAGDALRHVPRPARHAAGPARRAGQARRRGRHGRGDRARRDARVTFSLVACDREAKQWGVVVASKFLAVGAVVPWARADVGAIATQAFANITYGPDGLDLLAGGATAQETIDRLTAADAELRAAPDRRRRRGRRQRQLLGLGLLHMGRRAHRRLLRRPGQPARRARRWSRPSPTRSRRRRGRSSSACWRLWRPVTPPGATAAGASRRP